MEGLRGMEREPLDEARKIQQDAAVLGFDWPDTAGVMAKLHEEFGEIQEAISKSDWEEAGCELGDLLFTVVNLSRFLKVDPADALRRATAKFNRRFSLVQEEIGRQGRAMQECTLEELDLVWERVKRRAE